MSNTISPNNSPYSIVYYGLRLAGLINNDGRPWSLIYTIFQVFLVTIFGIAIVLEFFLGSLKEFILALSSFTIFIQVYSKLINIVSNEKQIRILLDRLTKYRSQLLEDEENRSLVTEADLLCRKYILYFNLFFLTFPFYSFVSNFFTDYLSDFVNPHLIHQLWIPWNMNELRKYLAGTILILFITYFIVAIYIASSTFQFTFTFQMSAYLKILQNRLETKGPGDKILYEQHKTIVKLMQDFNELFSTQIYAEIFIGSLEPCGFGYALIKELKRYEAGAFELIYKMALCLAGVFVLCGCGQELKSQFEKLHTSSYMNKWYEEKPKIRRDLLTLMLITIKPMTMNFKLFVKFDFECFATIIQGVYSCLMMMNNFETSD